MGSLLLEVKDSPTSLETKRYLHANAHGFSIADSKLESFIEKTNEFYKDIPQEPVYWVDYSWLINQVNSKVILDIADAKFCWGQGIPEPYVAIHDIPLGSCNIQLLSPDKHPTLKIHLPNGIDVMKFKSSEEEFEEFIRPNQHITAVCRCNKNEWNGRVTPQLIIEDFGLEEKWVF